MKLRFVLASACALVSTLAAGGVPPMRPTPALPVQPDSGSPNLLVLELRLNRSSLADSLYAYETGDDVLLPLGELMRLLTMGITVDPDSRVASGYILDPQRSFRLDPATATVTLPGGTETYDPRQVRWIEGDLHVARKLLQRWLPLDFRLELSTLVLEVMPREKLPLQARLEREQQAKGLGARKGGVEESPAAARVSDYSLASVPFVDQTLGLSMTRNKGQQQTSSLYSAFITGDLLGTEASAYVSSSDSHPQPELRMTLSRHDPEAGLLGPLQARSVSVGNIVMPALAGVLRGSAKGNGLLVSNRPLGMSSSFGLHTLRGDLPPGWDVTLYFNDALIGFQQSRPDGLYVFEDLVLVFGENEFRLVFNGPMGQTRVERQVFMLDQSLTRPGEFYYTLAGQEAENGGSRQSLQFDVGLGERLAATGGVVSLPASTQVGAGMRHYSNIGLRASLAGMLLSADQVQADNGGALSELGLRTRLGKVALTLAHTELNDFSSDYHMADSDPLKTRDLLRLSSNLPLGEQVRLPVALDMYRDRTAAGVVSDDLQGRISGRLFGAYLTNSLRFRSSAGNRTSAGALQLSYRIAGIALGSQLAYQIKPETRVSSVAVTASKELDAAQRLNLGLLQLVEGRDTVLTAGWTRNFGSVGLGLSGRYSSSGELAVGLQLFMAFGFDARSKRAIMDWQPMADAGAVSARAFLDTNQNGRFDAGEEALENVGFMLNGGSRHPVRTGPDGLAYLSRMTPRQYMDIALDTATLEDPQWMPELDRIRILPRPGKVQELDFPVVMTGEVDGMVYLSDKGRARGIGNAEVELVDAADAVVARGVSSVDGYYIVQAVRPGRYRARIAPAQLARLGLICDKENAVEIRADGTFANGVDFTLHRKGS